MLRVTLFFYFLVSAQFAVGHEQLDSRVPLGILDGEYTLDSGSPLLDEVVSETLEFVRKTKRKSVMEDEYFIAEEEIARLAREAYVRKYSEGSYQIKFLTIVNGQFEHSIHDGKRGALPVKVCTIYELNTFDGVVCKGTGRKSEEMYGRVTLEGLSVGIKLNGYPQTVYAKTD